MFGQDTHSHQDTNQIPDQSIDAAMTGDDLSQAPVSPQTPDPGVGQFSAPPVDDGSIAPDTPFDGNRPSVPAVSTPYATSPVPPMHADDDSGVHPNDLIDIKQQALSQLSPLLGHLEQTPEEKFRTTMMLIQASDDQSMIKPAYEAAQAITDEKVRAQALLDIVNEINYFTQNRDNQ